MELIFVNKHQGSRSLFVEYSYVRTIKTSQWCKYINNAWRHLEWKEVLDIVKIFISTKFEGGRHLRRVKNILSLVLVLWVIIFLYFLLVDREVHYFVIY